MKWYRSWPRDYKGSLSHIVDNMPKLLMSNYNYRTIDQWPDDKPGICMLEWDVALDQTSRYKFESEALASPYEVLVASYQLGSSYLPRNEDDNAISLGEDDCAKFGFGCIYFPNKLVKEFSETTFDFNDSSFSLWHMRHYGRARVTWNVHPQHVHYYEDV